MQSSTGQRLPALRVPYWPIYRANRRRAGSSGSIVEVRLYGWRRRRLYVHPPRLTGADRVAIAEPKNDIWVRCETTSGS
jgi:hypothetical protein